MLVSRYLHLRVRRSSIGLTLPHFNAKFPKCVSYSII